MGIHDILGVGQQIRNAVGGAGPLLQPLLDDPQITDILVNGPKQVYVERRGKLEMTDVVFDDNAHVLNVCNRIVSRIGRRVDESSPIADARLLDGSFRASADGAGANHLAPSRLYRGRLSRRSVRRPRHQRCRAPAA